MSSTELVGIEATIAEWLAIPGTMDAIAWLHTGTVDTPHILSGCLTYEESIDYVKNILEMGAVSVLSVGPSPKCSRPHIRNCLVIELAEDPEVRQKLYDWNVAISEEYLCDATEDIGTTHMLHYAGCRATDVDFDEDEDDDEEYDGE